MKTICFIITEKVWPLETDVSANQTVTEGETARFHCIVTNDRSARIQWLRIPPKDPFGGVPKHMVRGKFIKWIK